MREQLAHVAFRGTIRERSVEPYLRLLKTLRFKRRVKGVLLDLSSGGGEAIASMDFYLAVKRLNEIKPVYASIGSMGASGAYMAALGARRILAYPESDVGSIGVISAHFAVRDLLRRLGVSVELLHAGVHKDAYQGYRPLTEVERAKLQAITQEGYDVFVRLVATERKRTVEEILPLATGEFWTGTQALKLGLIDGLADREAALEELAQLTGVPSRKTVRVTPPRSLLDRVFAGPAASLGSGLFGRFQDAVEDAVLDSERYSLRR
ncbi:MAG: signal peptide peptidase SppA [Thermoplasmata archaeon]